MSPKPCVPRVKDDLPTARDLMVRYGTNKKTTKRKKKLEKAMKVLKVRRGPLAGQSARLILPKWRARWCAA